jgi:hypothetical protein
MSAYETEQAHPWPEHSVTISPPKGAPLTFRATLHASPDRPAVETRWGREKLEPDPDTEYRARVQTITGPGPDGRADRVTVAPLVLNGVPHSLDLTFVLRSAEPIVWAEDRDSAAYALRRVSSTGEYLISDAASPTDKARAYLWRELPALLAAALKSLPALAVEDCEHVRRVRYAAHANEDADRLAAMAGELHRRAGRLAK